MLVTIQIKWTARPAQGGTLGTYWDGVGRAFNTATQKIEPYTNTYYAGVIDPAPYDVPLPAVGTLIHFECGAAPDYDKVNYYYGAGDTVTSDIERNSPTCGWTPPGPTPPTCDLQLTLKVINGDTIQAVATGAHGNVTYSIDGGLTRRTSDKFGPLVAGTYDVYAYDDAPLNCRAKATLVLTPAVPVVLPTAAPLPAVGFSRNPLALVTKASAAGRALLVQLFVEPYHGANSFTRLSQRLRPTDSAGQAVVQVQDQLHAVLTPVAPDLTQTLGLRRLRSVIRRYFVTLAEVQQATGTPGPAVQFATCTVLHGGRSWPAARAGNFFDPLPAGFLTWRPATEQVVGRQHVALLAALVPASAQAALLRVRCFRRATAVPFAEITDTLALPGVIAGQAATPFLLQAQVPMGDLDPNTFRVEVALVLDGQVQTARTYQLDALKVHRQYIFLNSLGQWDTLSCTGPLNSKTSVERTVATRLLPPDYDPQDGPESVVDTTLDARLTVSTGAVSPAELEYLRELLLSRHVYEVQGRALRKIRLTTKDLVDYQDNAGQDGFSFEYAYCFDTTLFDNARLTHV